jgi:hypothetical protein
MVKLARFDMMVDDAVALIQRVQTEHPALPFFVHGHSMGGIICARAVMRVQGEAYFRGAVFSAPAIRVLGQGLVPGPCVYCCLFQCLGHLASAVSCGYFSNPAAPDHLLTTSGEVLARCKEDTRVSCHAFVLLRFNLMHVYIFYLTCTLPCVTATGVW